MEWRSASKAAGRGGCMRSNRQAVVDRSSGGAVSPTQNVGRGQTDSGCLFPLPPVGSSAGICTLSPGLRWWFSWNKPRWAGVQVRLSARHVSRFLLMRRTERCSRLTSRRPAPAGEAGFVLQIFGIYGLGVVEKCLGDVANSSRCF